MREEGALAVPTPKPVEVGAATEKASTGTSAEEPEARTEERAVAKATMVEEVKVAAGEAMTSKSIVDAAPATEPAEG